MSRIGSNSESLAALCRVPSAPSRYGTRRYGEKYNFFSTGKGLIDISPQHNIYNTARNLVYSRYSEQDWTNSNNLHYTLSEKERSMGHRIRADAWRAVQETEERTRKRQAENSARLMARRNDVNNCKENLVNESRRMEKEIEALQESTRVLEKAYQWSAEPLHVTEECMLHRDRRIGIDRVYDEVERELTKEAQTIKDCQEMMRKLIQKAHAQLKMNRASLHGMDIDRENKNHAGRIDDLMYQLRNSSTGIGYYPGVETLDNTVSDPKSWLKFTQTNIARSEKDREASQKLGEDIDTCLRTCSRRIWTQYITSTNCLISRIHETRDTKEKLQRHIERVIQEIVDMDKSIGLLQKAILDKEGYMKVAQTRLEERAKKLQMEICRDQPMNGIISEIEEIKESVSKLKQSLTAAEFSMARLIRTKSQLENDIEVKETSLKIDAKDCMGLRKSLPKNGFMEPVTKTLM
ncbi:tektin-3-like [Watersipora subatra]|uniref:tektin-3-like n=1 Tax=Watersipora subatra TaxID=2589382 RepID=UPI00355BA4E9